METSCRVGWHPLVIGTLALALASWALPVRAGGRAALGSLFAALEGNLTRVCELPVDERGVQGATGEGELGGLLLPERARLRRAGGAAPRGHGLGHAGRGTVAGVGGPDCSVACPAAVRSSDYVSPVPIGVP